ncbi:MAG: hypothetical protein PHV68_03945, partial [Candidatus Gastranaerophilales bacterium]|nr:hypothetical protein [Candidatus Gastranaerophilales bacterium]
AEADTIMGIIGVKVWVFKGEVLPGEKADSNVKAKTAAGAEGARAGRRRPARAPRGPKREQQK